MPYHQLFYHIVWSTYDRLPMINDHNCSAIHKAIIDKVQRLSGVVYAINSVCDHLHLVASLPPVHSLATCIGQLKGCSSHLATRIAQGAEPFRWQAEYGVMSIGKGQLPRFVSYVERQQQRHGAASFEDILAGG